MKDEIDIERFEKWFEKWQKDAELTLDWAEEIALEPPICTCSIQTLMIKGCQCGAME